MSVKRHFTFGTAHVHNHPDITTPLSEGWITVDLPVGYRKSHRRVFMEEFTGKYCPSPTQFAFEYTDNELSPRWFPDGCLLTIKKENLDA